MADRNIERLSTYIKNIECGQAVNLPKFKSLINGLDLDRESSVNDIEARKQKGQLYIVTHIKDDLLKALTTLVNEKGISRAGAARQNKSHSQKVNGSFIVVREGTDEPKVVLIDSEGKYSSDLNYSSTALIIENRQNFLDIRKMIHFLSDHTDFTYEQGMNIIFSEGNAITNSLHKMFLSRYSHIYLCLDFDLGGLKIADNLMHLLPDRRVEFLVPDDIAQRLDRVVELADKSAINAVVDLGFKNSRLASSAKIISDKRKTLEQEGYLND